MKTGIKLISLERERQITKKGWTREHDSHHQSGELNDAAIAYAQASAYLSRGESIEWVKAAEGTGKINFPWEEAWWKPSPDRVRNLVKAGALIAAEIDRLNRLSSNGPTA